jgi:hypothetical protein
MRAGTVLADDLSLRICEALESLMAVIEVLQVVFHDLIVHEEEG